MNAAKLTHGPAEEIASYLSAENEVTKDEILSALINALNRIDNLEKQVKTLLKCLDE